MRCLRQELKVDRIDARGLFPVLSLIECIAKFEESHGFAGKRTVKSMTGMVTNATHALKVWCKGKDPHVSPSGFYQHLGGAIDNS